MRSLLARVADVLARSQESAGPCWERPDRGRRAPGSGGAALAQLPSGEPIRLMVIEHDVPDIPDRQVQLADGFLDLPGSRKAADQAQCRFESEPCGEQPRATMSVMPAAMRSRSCATSGAASAQSAALPGGGSRVGRMLASSGSGVVPLQNTTIDDVSIAAYLGPDGRDWMCRQGPRRRE